MRENLHHVYNLETLRRAHLRLKREAAPGVDGVTWREYGEQLEENLADLSLCLKSGGYRAKPVRRVLIPKPDGRQRPLGVTALEDKVVQRAGVEVLEQIYEADFLGFSYGFRPGRNHGWLVRFVEHRIADRRIVRLIQKWLKAGVLSRRSQKGRVTWARVSRLARLWLPPVRVTHPYPSERPCLTT